MRVVPLEAFRDRIPMADAIAAVENGFRALAKGDATVFDPLVAELRDRQAEIHVKGAHLKGAPFIVLKLATGFYGNAAKGLPSGDGLFLLLDAHTGRPEYLIEEHGYLTDLRTAAAIALTLKYLAPKGVREALLVGAGAVARLAAQAIVAGAGIDRLTIWNRTPERAQQLAERLSSLVPVRVAGVLETEVSHHRIIVTATAATTPLIHSAWVQRGTHVTSAGTGSPEKVELEPALLARADKLVADRVTQTARYGNLHHAVAAGVMVKEPRCYGELADLASGRLPGRERDDEITVADLTGVGVQDAAIAPVVVAALEGAEP